MDTDHQPLLGTMVDVPATVLERKLKDEKARRNGFDWLFVRRFYRISKVLFALKWTVFTFAIMVVASILQIWVISLTGDVTGGFGQSIVDKDSKSFWKVFWLALAVVSGSAVLDSSIRFIGEVLAWRWRRTLCYHLHQKYFVNTLFYKLVSLQGKVDNPDQRIAQDVDNFSTTLNLVISSTITAPLNMCFYFYKNWVMIGWFAPVAITVFYLFGYLINKLIMTPIVRLVFNQEKLEGDFRFSHIRVRNWAESIALYGGGDVEKQYTESNFKELMSNKMRILKRQWTLNTSTNAFTYAGSILNYFVIAIPVLFVTTDVVPDSYYVIKGSFNSIMLIAAFSSLMNISTPMSELAGFTSRIGDLLESLDELEKKHQEDEDRKTNDDPMNGNISYDDFIQFDNVSCYTPTGIQLTQKLNFRIDRGTNLLIMGPTGCGKTSILRVLNGLWPLYEGNITKPGDGENEKMFYLPQRPYLFTATLRDLILYPEKDPTESLAQFRLRELLESVGLSELLALYSVDEEVNWADVLSPGEQQLISFARLFYHQPLFAILDEATSSLHESMEAKLYVKCTELGITLVSVGHRMTLKNFHNQLLELDSEHNWAMSNIS